MLTASIRSFERLLGVNVCFQDHMGKLAPLIDNYYMRHMNLACAAVKSITLAKCMHFENVTVADALTAHPERCMGKICHAGIFEITVPIRHAQIIIGFLFAGPFAYTGTKRNAAVICAERAVPPKERVLSDIPKIDEKQMKDHFALASMLAQTISRAIEDHDAVSLAAAGHVPRINYFMFQRYHQDISIADVARFLGVTESRTGQLIRKHFKMTFPDLLNECRLDHAKKLLAGTSLPISRIAYSTGFNDANYFFRAFRKRCGMTPRQYRLREGMARI